MGGSGYTGYPLETELILQPCCKLKTKTRIQDPAKLENGVERLLGGKLGRVEGAAVLIYWTNKIHRSGPAATINIHHNK